MLYRRAGQVLTVLGCTLILLGVVYGSIMGYFLWREHVSPSTERVLVLKDGRRIPLVQPTMPPAQPSPTRQATVQPGSTQPVVLTPTEVNTPGPRYATET